MRAVLDRRRILASLGTATIASAFGAAAQEPPFAEENWSDNGLNGTFVVPKAGPARGRAALILAGSGPTSRDGSWNTYRQLAEGLAAAGIRTLRYDKRGIGASRDPSLREENMVIDTFANDAVAAARNIAQRPDVSATFIIGHSEGALLAVLAAAKMPLAGIVLLAGPGRRLNIIMREQLQKLPAPEALRTEAFAILDELAAGRRVRDVPQIHWPLFRPSVQPFLISFFAIDPAERFSRLSTPALVVHAERDIQVARADFDALVKARPDAKSWIAPEANHVFKRAPADLSDRAAQVKSYDAAAPLVPDLVPKVTEFLHAAR